MQIEKQSFSHSQQVKDEIDRLLGCAETGEQWAHICWLEQRMLELKSEEQIDSAELNYTLLQEQVPVGA